MNDEGNIIIDIDEYVDEIKSPRTTTFFSIGHFPDILTSSLCMVE